MKTINELRTGEKAVIRRIKGDPRLKRRLLIMGAVPGTEVVMENIAPLGDPVAICLKGFHLSLRREEAQQIDVEEI